MYPVSDDQQKYEENQFHRNNINYLILGLLYPSKTTVVSLYSCSLVALLSSISDMDTFTFITVLMTIVIMCAFIYAWFLVAVLVGSDDDVENQPLRNNET
uniref:Transmembrane protein n=1 Tax=Steinernema glaseri TaxID=37863 RepID=A0A1I8AJQ3_9BILA